MTLPTFFRNLTACAALAVSAGALRVQGDPRITNILLVHGAWAGGSCWSKVIPRLRALGLNVVAVQLPLISVADDVATIERALALENGPTLLVGHSYGGVVITEAGQDPKVAGLGYVSAYAPVAGSPHPPSRMRIQLL
jgi:pimeloyl-ACP methyl ester carboxylesterase